MKSVQWNFLNVAAVALLVAGCGGGGGTTDDGATSSPPPATGTTTTKTTFVTGAIAGFGSVIVNGVRYDTDSAQVSIEDKPATAGELRVGEVIHLTAEVDAQGVARAKSITQDHLIQGAVQAVDAVAGTLTIAGQVITVDNETMFDDSIPTRSLAGIAVGDMIEVHGFASAGGTARATRIEKAGAGETEVEVTGVVSNLDTGLKRFNVGTLVVDYSAATLEDFGSTGIAAGNLVEVKGTSFLADGALRATKVEREGHDSDGRSGDDSEVEGLVTRFGSATDFDVAGQKVIDQFASTVFVNGTAADLQAQRQGGGRGQVRFDQYARCGQGRVQAAVDGCGSRPWSKASTRPAARFRALGVTVVVSSTTRKEDHESDDHFFSLGRPPRR